MRLDLNVSYTSCLHHLHIEVFQYMFLCFSSFSLMRFIVLDFYKSLASFQACISQGRLLTDTSDHCRQSGNPSMILEVIFYMY
jgi:hypothetical protein